MGYRLYNLMDTWYGSGKRLISLRFLFSFFSVLGLLSSLGMGSSD